MRLQCTRDVLDSDLTGFVIWIPELQRDIKLYVIFQFSNENEIYSN